MLNQPVSECFYITESRENGLSMELAEKERRKLFADDKLNDIIINMDYERLPTVFIS
jgi:hypothetical protein